MKIGLIIKDLRHCGAQRVMARLSFILKDAGHDVFMILFTKKYIDYEYAGELIVIDSLIGKGIIGKIITTLKRTHNLRKVKQNYNFDATISFLDTPNISNLLSKNKEITCVSVRNFKSLEDKGIFNFFNKIMIKLLYPKADKVIVVSKAILVDMALNYNIPKSKMKVIYNPYDIDLIEEQSLEELPNDFKKFYDTYEVIVSVGRLSRQKGFWNLIKAFSYLKKDYPYAGLVIIGDGDQELQLKELTKELQIENDVLFTGYQKNPFPFIKNAKAYALTSLFEGFPNALVEAMACGTPTVSVDCKSGPREILFENADINDSATNVELADYGLLCPAFTDADNWDSNVMSENQIIFSKALSMLFEDDKLHEKYCKKSFERASHFTFEECKNKFQEILLG